MSHPNDLLSAEDLEMTSKKKELEDLDAVLKIRMGQIERAEARLLAVQQQILGLASAVSDVLEPSGHDLFRIDTSINEGLRAPETPAASVTSSPTFYRTKSSLISPAPPSPYNQLKTSSISNSMDPIISISPLNYQSSSSLHKSMAITNNEHHLSAPSASSLSSSTSIVPQITPNRSSSAQPLSSKLIESKTNTTASNLEVAKSNPPSITMTIIRSLFSSSTGTNVTRSVHLKVEASQIRLCEKLNHLCTPHFDVYRANVGGWGCHCKLIESTEEESRYLKRVKLLEELPTHPNIARYWFHDSALIVHVNSKSGNQANNNINNSNGNTNISESALANAKQCHRIFTEWFHTNLIEVVSKRTKLSPSSTPTSPRKQLVDSQGSDEPPQHTQGKNYFKLHQLEHILLEVVKGLEFLHSYSILHRDISPFNIQALIENTGDLGRIAITNLDMAKVVLTGSTKSYTQGYNNNVHNNLNGQQNASNTIASKLRDPRFCSPEVVNPSTIDSCSYSADVWSFGLLVYYLLTLEVPWAHVTDHQELVNTIMNGERPDIHAAGINLKQFPEYSVLVDIFQECTRKNPEDRPTMSQVRQALITNSSISDHKRASEMNIGFTYQPKREFSTFFEHFLIIGCPFGARKPEQSTPTLLFQYPSNQIRSLQNSHVIINFSMAQHRASQRIKRSTSMSNINSKLFSSRESIEQSSAACIFTMMEGEELRYGICVYFEEPVDLIPSFMSVEAIAKASQSDTEIDVSKLSKYPPSLKPPSNSAPPTFPFEVPQVTHHHPVNSGSNGTTTSSSKFAQQQQQQQQQRNGNAGSNNHTNGDSTSSVLPALPKRPRGHLRTASHGSTLSHSTSSVPAAPLPTIGHVKFTHRCYMLFSKWPFFKLHFEVLWSMLAQERLTRITPPSSSSSHSDPPKDSSPLSKLHEIHHPNHNNQINTNSTSHTELSSPRKARSVSVNPSGVPLASGSINFNGSPTNTSFIQTSPRGSHGLPKEGASTNSPTSPRSILNHPIITVSASPPIISQMTAAAVASTVTDRPDGGNTPSPLSPSDPCSQHVESIASGSSISSKSAKRKSAKGSSRGRARKTSGGASTMTTPAGASPPDDPISAIDESSASIKMITSYYKEQIPSSKSRTAMHIPGLQEAIVYTPGDVTECVADWCFPALFRNLSSRNILRLFTAVLLEERTAIICNDSGILTAAVTGITSMLRPFAWQGTFMPIVPSNMEAVLDSPIPFIVGLTARPAEFDEIMNDGTVVDVSSDTCISKRTLPKLPLGDRLLDAFNLYSSSIRQSNTGSNCCKSNQADLDSLAKLLSAFSSWHASIVAEFAEISYIGLDFNWTDQREVEKVIKALPYSDRDFYRDFVATQHFSIHSALLNSNICEIRGRKGKQKQVEKLENILSDSNDSN